MSEKFTDWMEALARPEDNEAFSQMVHEYFKLAGMRVMQALREKYGVPPDDIPTLFLAVWSRMFNEGVYAIGAHVKGGMPLHHIFAPQHLMNLLNVLQGEGLDLSDRTDIEKDLEANKLKFREFIMKEASSFYLNDDRTK